MQGDTYAGYHPVHAHTRHLGCWMHARRKFVDAQDNDPRAVEALAFIPTGVPITPAEQPTMLPRIT